jgi:DNA-binding NarL/FixJ family response regulator
MDTVLIADRDLGFVFWLGVELNKLGYLALPALNESQAATMAKQYPPDVVVFSPSFPSAADLVESLRQPQKPMRVVVLSSDPDERLQNLRDLKTAIEKAPEVDLFLGERAPSAVRGAA